MTLTSAPANIITPAVQELTTSGTALGTSIANLETLAGNRNEGTGKYHGATQECH